MACPRGIASFGYSPDLMISLLEDSMSNVLFKIDIQDALSLVGDVKGLSHLVGEVCQAAGEFGRVGVLEIPTDDGNLALLRMEDLRALAEAHLAGECRDLPGISGNE